MWGHHSAGLLSYAALYNIGMLGINYMKNKQGEQPTFSQVLMTVFYSYLSLGNKSAIGCEKVIPRSDSKLLDLHVWLGVETLIKSLRLVTLLKVRDELGIRLSNPYPN